jgi:hypothetical protein
MPETNPLFHIAKAALVVQPGLNRLWAFSAHTGAWANETVTVNTGERDVYQVGINVALVVQPGQTACAHTARTPAPGRTRA